MQDPPLGMRRLLGEREFGPFLVEFGTPQNEFPDPGRTFLDKGAYGLTQTEAVAGLDRIVEVDRDLILV